MINGKKVLAFVPARIGSKRIINKNLKELNNIPLFMHSVNVARKSQYIDDILVSSDSKAILKIAHANGCIKNNIRPSEYSQDNSRIIDGILYELKELKQKYDILILLQPTSPYRTKELVDGALEEYVKKNTSLITVVESIEQPIFMRSIVNNELQKIITDSSDKRSQDFSNYYTIVGSIYINNIKDLNSSIILNENKIPFIIDRKYAIDIDTEIEFEEAKKIMENLD